MAWSEATRAQYGRSPDRRGPVIGGSAAAWDQAQLL